MAAVKSVLFPSETGAFFELYVDPASPALN